MTPGSSPVLDQSTPGRSHRFPFAMMTVLFFMWGFMTVWNDILIPRFKEAFSLSYFQAMLVQFCFFGAYAVGAVSYYVVSTVYGDPLNRVGYSRGVVAGLLVSALGSLVFIPASLFQSYPLFLLALFIVGLGFALLQIAANPYVTILGPERTASSRLNLSQGFNSIGTTIGPIVGGWLIFEVFSRQGMHGADSVRVPYLCFGLVFVALAVVFYFARLPDFTTSGSVPRGLGALKVPHTFLGMIAIFMYVGGEVTVGSAIVNYLGLPSLGGMAHEQASSYLAFYWGGLMVGRFMGAFALSDMKPLLKRSLIVALPVASLLLVQLLPGEGRLLPAAVLLGVLLAAFVPASANPQRMLLVFSCIIITLLGTGILASGPVAMWAVLGVGLFCSIMWSNIFSLALEGLGPLKSQASSLLVMAIVGGAILPPIQGAVADAAGIQFSFIVPAVAFAYVAFYGAIGWKIGRSTAGAERPAHLSV